MDFRSLSWSSQRLLLRSFTPEDAPEAFAAVTPTLTRFMGWEPSPSREAFAEIWRGWFATMAAGVEAYVVVRAKSTLEFLGMAGLHDIRAAEPEAGIWIREPRHGHGYGREAVAAMVSFAARELGKRALLYPVVEQNSPSRRLAESLGGRIVGTRDLRKAGGATHPMVIYRIPAPA